MIQSKNLFHTTKGGLVRHNLIESTLRKQFCQIKKNILLVFMQQNSFVVAAKHFAIHAEKRSVKLTGSSVLIWTTWLFSKFYQKLSLINRFSVRFTQRPVKSTEYEKIRVKLIVLYANWIVQKICWLNSTSCKIY